MVGELFLDSRVKPVSGGLPMAIQAQMIGYEKLLLPRESAPEAAVLEGLAVYPVAYLSEVVEYLNGRKNLEAVRLDDDQVYDQSMVEELDFDEVKGQEHTKRGLEVAAAGGHNVLTLVQYLTLINSKPYLSRLLG